MGLLFSSDEDWVNGRIEEGDQQTPVKLRLKGDILDHLEGRKMVVSSENKRRNGLESITDL